MTSTPPVFTVDGRPFMPIGGQVHNSSAYNHAEMATAWRALELMHANVAEVPIYWEQIEPVEGQFDFSAVDMLLDSARARRMHLVLLWFGSWKNGMMKYVPAWVKRDQQRFRRVHNPAGKPIAVLSSHCAATLEADRRAFCALMAHLHAGDAQVRTVISVQIENEPGILGSDRDYGPEADAEFNAPVPAEIVAALHGDAWPVAADAQGTWPELFGPRAGELLSAWSIARFIDQLAVAGKQIYDLPMYVNVWLGEMIWRIPGLSYPSGGAVTGTLGLWRAAAPHLDLIAPDIYVQDHHGFRAICASYARPDNPLFVPESMPGASNALNMLIALAEYNAVGYAAFGIENLLGPDGQPTPDGKLLIDTFRSVMAVLPLVRDLRGSGKVHAVLQEEYRGWQYLELGEYIGIALFGAMDSGFTWRDFRHVGPNTERGRGLVIQTDDNEFYVTGGGFRLALTRRSAPGDLLLSPAASEFLSQRLANYVVVEEGGFEGETWVATRLRNGDESDYGVWVAPDVGAVRVVIGE